MGNSYSQNKLELDIATVKLHESNAVKEGKQKKKKNPIILMASHQQTDLKLITDWLF